jgi:hypothetical protein
MPKGIPKAAPKPAPKGGMGDMDGMDMRIKKRMEDIAFDDASCAGPEVTDLLGHKAKSSKGAHLAYNEDGFYVHAAACFVLKQFKAAGGA